MFYGFFSVGGLIFLVVLLVILLFWVLCEYECGVVFLFGCFWCVKGLGLVFIVLVIQQMVCVDLCMVVMDVLL